MRQTVSFFLVAMCVAVPVAAQQAIREIPAVPAIVEPQTPPPPPQPPQPARAPTPPTAPQRVAAPTPQAAPDAPAAPQRQVDPRIDQSDVNIKVTVTITDKSTTTMTKVVSLIMANKGNGRVRSSGSTLTPNLGVGTNRSSELNVDARATLFKSGAILTNMTISYSPEWTEEISKFTGVSQSVELFLKDGVPTVVAQAADPTKGSRSVTIEVTATVVK